MYRVLHKIVDTKYRTFINAASRVCDMCVSFNNGCLSILARTYGRHPLYVPLAETRRLHGYNIETPLGDDKMERRNTQVDKSKVESKNAVDYA